MTARQELESLRQEGLSIKALWNEARDMKSLFDDEGDPDEANRLKANIVGYSAELKEINSRIMDLKQEVDAEGDDLFYVRHLQGEDVMETSNAVHGTEYTIIDQCRHYDFIAGITSLPKDYEKPEFYQDFAEDVLVQVWENENWKVYSDLNFNTKESLTVISKVDGMYYSGIGRIENAFFICSGWETKGAVPYVVYESEVKHSRKG